jgi:hypothetical protein
MKNDETESMNDSDRDVSRMLRTIARVRSNVTTTIDSDELWFEMLRFAMLRFVKLRALMNKSIRFVWNETCLFTNNALSCSKSVVSTFKKIKKFDRFFVNLRSFDSDDLDSNNLSTLRWFDDSFVRSALNVCECEVFAWWEYDDQLALEFKWNELRDDVEEISYLTILFSHLHHHCLSFRMRRRDHRKDHEILHEDVNESESENDSESDNESDNDDYDWETQSWFWRCEFL